MQSTRHRCLILVLVLAIGALLQASIEGPRKADAARWPTEDAVYGVEDWAMGPLAVESAHGVHHVVRTYRRADGASATLAISTSPEAKRIYRAGAEVPFLANGYAVEPAPPDVVPPSPSRGALLVRREGELGLLLHTAGERRGLMGSGTLGWGMVVLDAVAGQPNDYYLARVMTPLDRLDSPTVGEAVRMAETLFARVADWYAD